MTEEFSVLGPDDPPPFEILQVEPSQPTLLVCDHASSLVPATFHNFGVSTEDMKTHCALDIGAGAVTRLLSRSLGLPAVLAGYSRLVVDCNRRLDDPSAFPVSIDGVAVPGNHELTHADRQARADALYWAYHHAVRDQLGRLESIARAPALIAVHSFVQVRVGEHRPWDIGILSDKDPRMSVPLIEALRKIRGPVVGDNAPYSGKHAHDFTVDHHAEAEGLPHVGIELRQDLIDTDAGAEHWAELLANVLRPILSDAGLYTHWTT
jgi:predicted N-formylglutamate amidohydrolase